MGEIFERTAPAIPLEWTGERLTSATSGQVEIEHLHRYFLARELCRGLDVLDVASGEGYGTALLAQTAKSAIGVEISPQSARHAAASYRTPNLRYLEGDARALPLGDASVDAVVSFETIEHFYEHDQFIAEIKRVLRPGGRLIISSPDRDIYSPPGSPANPYHVRELTRSAFEMLLGQNFRHVQLLSQRPVLGSALVADRGVAGARLTFERRGSNHFEVSDGLPRAVYLLAVATDAELEALPDSLYVDTDEVGALLGQAASAAGFEAGMTAMRVRAESAEAEAAAIRAEVALQGEQITGETAQLAALRAEVQNADRQLRSVDELLANQRQQADAVLAASQAELVTARQAAAVAERDLAGKQAELTAALAAAGALEQQLAAAEQTLAAVRAAPQDAAEMAALRDALAATREQVKAATSQRDLARIAMRRSAMYAENGLRSRVTEAERRLLDAQQNEVELEQRLAEQHDRLEDQQARLQELERLTESRHDHLLDLERVIADQQARLLNEARQAAEWQARYHGLRDRLEDILRRFWLLKSARVFPRPVRRWVREHLLGGRR
ncbi:MAG: hypothetical protein NVSMB18_16340 [Acetobacteraceae bacterium]